MENKSIITTIQHNRYTKNEPFTGKMPTFPTPVNKRYTNNEPFTKKVLTFPSQTRTIPDKNKPPQTTETIRKTKEILHLILTLQKIAPTLPLQLN